MLVGANKMERGANNGTLRYVTSLFSNLHISSCVICTTAFFQLANYCPCVLSAARSSSVLKFP